MNRHLDSSWARRRGPPRTHDEGRHSSWLPASRRRLVAEQDIPIAEGPRLRQLQGQPLLDAVEHRPSVTQNDAIHRVLSATLRMKAPGAKKELGDGHGLALHQLPHAGTALQVPLAVLFEQQEIFPATGSGICP